MMQEVVIKREFEAGLIHATTGKLCQPSSKWVPFSNYRLTPFPGFPGFLQKFMVYLLPLMVA